MGHISDFSQPLFSSPLDLVLDLLFSFVHTLSFHICPPALSPYTHSRLSHTEEKKPPVDSAAPSASSWLTSPKSFLLPQHRLLAPPRAFPSVTLPTAPDGSLHLSPPPRFLLAPRPPLKSSPWFHDSIATPSPNVLHRPSPLSPHAGLVPTALLPACLHSPLGCFSLSGWTAPPTLHPCAQASRTISSTEQILEQTQLSAHTTHPHQVPQVLR